MLRRTFVVAIHLFVVALVQVTFNAGKGLRRFQTLRGIRAVVAEVFPQGISVPGVGLLSLPVCSSPI